MSKGNKKQSYVLDKPWLFKKLSLKKFERMVNIIRENNVTSKNISDILIEADKIFLILDPLIFPLHFETVLREIILTSFDEKRENISVIWLLLAERYMTLFFNKYMSFEGVNEIKSLSYIYRYYHVIGSIKELQTHYRKLSDIININVKNYYEKGKFGEGFNNFMMYYSVQSKECN
jgi:hypothetical protein